MAVPTTTYVGTAKSRRAEELGKKQLKEAHLLFILMVNLLTNPPTKIRLFYPPPPTYNTIHLHYSTKVVLDSKYNNIYTNYRSEIATYRLYGRDDDESTWMRLMVVCYIV